MRTRLFIFSLILTYIMILYGCSEFSSTYPKLTFSSTTSSKSYDTVINGGTWFNKENGGNSFHLGGWDIDTAEDIASVEMDGNSTVELKLSSDKNLDYLKLSKIEGTDSSNQELIEIPLENLKFKLPEESGVYSYVACANFDETHNVKYVFKILVKGITKSPYDNIVETKDISSSIQEDKITTNTKELTMLFTNNSNIEYTYAPEPHLEVKDNNNWYVVSVLQKATWNDIGYILKPKDKSKKIISLKNYYGKLEIGQYRFIEEFSSDGNTIVIPVEFKVE